MVHRTRRVDGKRRWSEVTDRNVVEPEAGSVCAEDTETKLHPLPHPRRYIDDALAVDERIRRRLIAADRPKRSPILRTRLPNVQRCIEHTRPLRTPGPRELEGPIGGGKID